MQLKPLTNSIINTDSILYITVFERLKDANMLVGLNSGAKTISCKDLEAIVKGSREEFIIFEDTEIVGYIINKKYIQDITETKKYIFFGDVTTTINFTNGSKLKLENSLENIKKQLVKP